MHAHLHNAIETKNRPSPPEWARDADDAGRTGTMLAGGDRLCVNSWVEIGSHVFLPAIAPVRPLVFGRGMDALMGPPLDELGLTEKLAALFATPEWTMAAILNNFRDGDTLHRERQGTQVMNRARLADGDLPVRNRKRLELRNQWDGGFGQDLCKVLDELGILTETFSAWLSTDDHLLDFWDAIPSLHVVLELEIASTRQRGRPFEANDFRDMSFYEAAVPYADLLLTETYWAERIRYARLDQRYDIRVLHRLADLPSRLPTICDGSGSSTAQPAQAGGAHPARAELERAIDLARRNTEFLLYQAEDGRARVPHFGTTRPASATQEAK